MPSFTHSKKKPAAPIEDIAAGVVPRNKSSAPNCCLRSLSSFLPRRNWSPSNRIDLRAILAPGRRAGFPVFERREFLHNAAPCHAVMLLPISLDSDARRIIRQARHRLASLREPRPRIRSRLLPIMKLRGACVFNRHVSRLHRSK